ncbi:uncharacterized protein LOC130963259 [Arachis stenosperma]|uniref:uncharacterized protein LOC130963259 n=1 Tax=Arachis stenosperma TaxID=217475 RepID=UPI0025AC8EC5|nr:uncharacterized protein LOC130963259 [Arachis stenosperma]
MDRALSNGGWRIIFEGARVEVLPRTNSDHHPLLITTEPPLPTNKNRPFRYEAMWKMHPNFDEVIKDHWSQGEPFSIALNLEKRLRENLEEILNREEVMWLQKSREKWLVEGDRNTKYYHTRTIIRRRRKKVLKLRNHAGKWVEDAKDLERMAINYFKRLYIEEDDNQSDISLVNNYPSLNPSIKEGIDNIPIEPKIKRAIFNIGSLKAPGEDGFLALFFKENWSTMKDSIVDYIILMWEEPERIREQNGTLISLIPKVSNP